MEVKMDLSEFKLMVNELELIESNKIREKFINEFVQINSKYYKEHIFKRIKCSDGMCYTGYIWGCIRGRKLIDYDMAITYIEQFNDVYVMWDINSKNRIFIPDYWKFEKESILKLNSKLLMNNLQFFPEDIYVFNDTYEWTIALTHEDIDGKSFCLFVTKF